MEANWCSLMKAFRSINRRSTLKSQLINWAGLFVAVAAANLIPAMASAQITFLNTWGSYGHGNTQLYNPDGVAVGPTGTVYVADQGNDRVQVFNSSGVYQSTIGTTDI